MRIDWNLAVCNAAYAVYLPVAILQGNWLVPVFRKAWVWILTGSLIYIFCGYTSHLLAIQIVSQIFVIEGVCHDWLPQSCSLIIGWWVQASVPSGWWMYSYPAAIPADFSPTNRYMCTFPSEILCKSNYTWYPICGLRLRTSTVYSYSFYSAFYLLHNIPGRNYTCMFDSLIPRRSSLMVFTCSMTRGICWG